MTNLASLDLRGHLRTVTFLSVCFCLSTLGYTEELPTKKVLTLDVAKKVAAAAAATARENQWKVCIAIVDEGGNLLYFERMDDVQTGSILVSQRKAEAAAAFRRPTKAFEEGVAGGRTVLVALPGGMPFEGGVPLMVGDQLVGAIGVSGATAQQDGIMAQSGADALKKLAK